MGESNRSDPANGSRARSVDIIIPTYNCFDKLVKCLEHCFAQTIETRIWVLNNGSDMRQLRRFSWSGITMTHHYPCFLSLSGAWNYALSYLFSRGREHVLVLNNDVYLQPQTCELLLKHAVDKQRGFVTGVSVGDPDPKIGEEMIESPHPDFSCFLISRECYHIVGPFDEHFIPCYKEDQDYHWRMQLAKIEAVKINVPFEHDRSSTTKDNSDAAERVAKWTDFRNQYYESKWGKLWPDEIYSEPFNGMVHNCFVCNPQEARLKDARQP